MYDQCLAVQLLVGSLADSEWAHCGPGGASIINSVHFAKDPGGKMTALYSHCCEMSFLCLLQQQAAGRAMLT